jgi:hypothetical protein
VHAGDLAMPKRAASPDVRIVSHFDGQYAALIALDEAKPEKRFLADYVRIIKFGDLIS